MSSVVLAKALYNNDSEADDELSFNKGDVVTVLETDYEGMEGWWLCSLGDKQGVAPGNRLQLISYGEIYDTPGSAYKETYGDVDYDVPKSHKGLSPEFQDYAVPKSPYGGIILPESQRHGFVLPSPRLLNCSDVRNSNSSDGMISNEVYDAPSIFSSERSSAEFRFSAECYQESGPEEIYDVPSRNSMESDDDVTTQQGNTLRIPDIPPKISKPHIVGYHVNNSDLQGGQEIYDTPSSAALGICNVSAKSSEVKLPMSNDGEKLSKLLQSLTGDCNDDYDTIPDEIYDVPPTTYVDGHPTALEEIYDVPPNSDNGNPIAPDDMYDVPPSSDGGYPTVPGDMYDVLPSSDGGHLTAPDDMYDVPPSSDGGYPTVPGDMYDVPPSSDGGLSTTPEDMYDVIPSSDGGYPAAPEDMYDVIPASDDRHLTMPEDVYEVPPRELTQTFFGSRDLPADGNNNPASAVYYEGDEIKNQGVRNESFYHVPSGEAWRVYDIDTVKVEKELKMEEVKGMGNEKRDSGPRKRLEQSDSDDYVDYQEIYGMGKEERKVGEKEKSVSSVLDRINMEKVRELCITRGVAMTNLDKLQQAVDVAVTKLLSFVTEDWREPEVLQLNINGIRELSGKVKVALRLLTEFGLGTLVNSQKLGEKEIYRKIKEALEPSLYAYYSIKSAIQRLDETGWKSAYHMRDDDELNSIVKLAQGIPCDAYNLGAVIANISSLLFDKNDEQSRSNFNETKTSLRNSLSYTSPATAQRESVKGLELKKVKSEPVGYQKKLIVTSEKRSTPPKIYAKPKRNGSLRKEESSAQGSFSESVSELTNNLLNQIEDMKSASPTELRRQGSKKLSPKSVRRLCSIGDKNEKIFEDVASVPLKPSRLCSSSAENDSTTVFQGESYWKGAGKSSSSSSLTNTAIQEFPKSENGDAKDPQRLSSFVEKMDSQVVILKEGIKNFGESVRECQIPKVFVAHSKFIVLSAHKLVYIGDGASRSLTNVNTRKKIADLTNSLSEIINDFVENIKVAARQYPSESAMNVMIKSAANVTEKALKLYKALKDHAES